MDWSSLVGVATLAWVLLFLGGYALYAGPATFVWKYLTPTPEMQSFMLGGLVLGFFSTWVGMYLWNLGSSRLPVTFAGQLTVFETIFGLLFVFLVDQQVPSLVEAVGASMMLSGVIFSINTFKKQLEAHAS
jgi:drug/metabolite transporter (DMT)-like permease